MCGQGKKKVAVFETQGTAKAGIREEIKNALVDGIRNNPRFIGLERAALSQVIREQSLQMSDEFDDDQAVKVGRLAGADYICTSSVNSANDFEYRIVYRLVNVETGETIASERKKATQNNVYDIIDEIANSTLFANDKSAEYISACNCQIQKQDLPTGENCPKGWRLPTLNELKCMCAEKNNIGGFNFGIYWSSTNSMGHRKGIKFDFCNEVFITGKSASIRCVEGKK